MFTSGSVQMNPYLLRLRGEPRAQIAAWTLIVLVVVTLLGPPLYDIDPNTLDLANAGTAPSWAHLLGTDESGRDLLSRLLAGGRVSLMVGVAAMFVSVVAGTCIGFIAGYHRGWVDTLLMRLTDAALALPTLFVVIAVVSFLGSGAGTVIAAIGITSWMGVSRLVRGELLLLREQPFLEAARALGGHTLTTTVRHLWPHLLPTILVCSMLGVGSAILTESALSFLGLGLQPPAASWGNMLSGAQTYVASYPWLAAYPGLLIVITTVAVNSLGESLRDAVHVPRPRAGPPGADGAAARAT